MIPVIIGVISYVILFMQFMFTFVFNHLIVIPLSLLFGVGKYVAFVIAVIIDQVQLIAYHNLFNQSSWKRRLVGAINDELIKKYRMPGFIPKLQKSWRYFGVSLLALLPVYSGGMFVAVFTAHVLRLKKIPGYISITIGSIIGSVIWTIGLINLVGIVIKFFSR